ncbi:MAG: hypothetical protein VX938_09280, partial [Myxococcota bacterium]|nr:hypothetical protein [Myxococcota bacterium]
MQCSQEAFAPRVQTALEDFGVVGTDLRDALSRDFTSKLLLRQGRDHLHLVGPPGTGKNLVADVAHSLARDVLGRTDDRIDLSCRDERGPDAWSAELRQAVAAADGGTLVMQGYEALDQRQRSLAGDVFREAEERPLVISIARTQGLRPDTNRPLTRIEMR